MFRTGLLQWWQWLRNRNLCAFHSRTSAAEKNPWTKKDRTAGPAFPWGAAQPVPLLYCVSIYIYMLVYIYIYMLVYIYVLVYMLVYVSICISLMSEFWVDGGESKRFTVDERDAKQGSMCSAMLVRICSHERCGRRDEPWKMWKPWRLDTQIITKLAYNRPWPWRTPMTLPSMWLQI